MIHKCSCLYLNAIYQSINNIFKYVAHGNINKLYLPSGLVCSVLQAKTHTYTHIHIQTHTHTHTHTHIYTQALIPIRLS